MILSQEISRKWKGRRNKTIWKIVTNPIQSSKIQQVKII